MTRDELVDLLSGMVLFSDLPRPQIEGIVHIFEEEMFQEGQRILRQGLTGSNFYVILDGQAAIRIDGQDRATLGRGDFFGEVSVLLREPPTADVVALGPLRCLVLSGTEVESFLVDHPQVMFRMLQTEARRLRATILWRS